MREPRIVVIGAGIGGLVAALRLASHGIAVTVVERAAAPGGKMRRVSIDGAELDGGPTVFTMRWVFDDIFAAAGTALADEVTLRPLDVLARHAWSGGETLDLFADIDRSAEAIGAFAGAAQARGYREFCARARTIYRTLENPFIRAARPSPFSLVRDSGLAGLVSGLGGPRHIAPFVTLWNELGRYFKDPRLRQLFARYATYCGSSPFLATATLMLIAEVERQGVWRVEGGLHEIAKALARLAQANGASFRYETEAREIVVLNRRVTGVTLASGEVMSCEAVVANADTAALAQGRFGAAAAGFVPDTPKDRRSLSAVTWAMHVKTGGFSLLRHNVFFSRDYPAEFADIRRGGLPADPTVYVCAQDRDDEGLAPGKPRQRERLLCLVNAPPTGDTQPPTAAEISQCEERMLGQLARCGLTVQRRPEAMLVTSPKDFEALFPATGGALYGPASHGWRASFSRPTSLTKLAGLYLAGGSVHPGAGVPMAALSGCMAAAAALQNLASSSRTRALAASIGRSPRGAMPGGMSTR